MKYACIDRRRDHYPVRMMCRLLCVSASGYYAWRTRPESARTRQDRELVPKIRKIFAVSKGVYGSPRVHAELVAEGVTAGRNKVARLMRLERLRGCPKRRFRVTTQRDPAHPVAKNLLKRNFEALEPNQRWASDITYISTKQGWLYLAVVMDLFSRRIVGWSMSQRMGRPWCSGHCEWPLRRVDRTDLLSIIRTVAPSIPATTSEKSLLTTASNAA